MGIKRAFFFVHQWLLTTNHGDLSHVGFREGEKSTHQFICGWSSQAKNDAQTNHRDEPWWIQLNLTLLGDSEKISLLCESNSVMSNYLWITIWLQRMNIQSPCLVFTRGTGASCRPTQLSMESMEHCFAPNFTQWNLYWFSFQSKYGAQNWRIKTNLNHHIFHSVSPNKFHFENWWEC